MGLSASKTAPPEHKTVVISEEDSHKPPAIEFSKQVLDFNLGEDGCPLNTAVFDEVELKNTLTKKIKFKFDPVQPPTCQLSFTPPSGTLDKGKTKKVRVRLLLIERVNLNFKVTLRIQGGDSLFLNLKVQGEKGVFGVDPLLLPQTDDGGYQVPVVLADMKELLIQNNGLTTEGIFRLAGEQTEIKRIKELMNSKKWDKKTNDVSAIASLTKIWFRELPIPILNALPQESIMGFQDSSDCVAAYNSLPEPNKSLLNWLLDFMTQVVAHSATNKMTAQNIAIVVAPNLYDISTPNPLEGLFLSQKCAAFLHHILQAILAGQINTKSAS